MEAVLDLNRQHLQRMTDTVAAAVTTNVERLIAAKEEDSTRNRNQGKIQDQCAHIERCDGLITEDIREWIRNVQLAVQNTQTIPHNVRRIARKTTTGQLYRAIERWCIGKPDAEITWANLSHYVQDAFLGSNEAERLRLDLAEVKQGADSILMFNRKYRELADAVYGENRGNDAERTVIRHYLTALKDRELAKKVIMENKTATLTETINFVDRMAMGLELYNTLFEGEEPMDCSVIGKEKEGKTDVEKKMERQETKIAKLQAQLRQMTLKGLGMSRPGRPIKCFECGQEGHVRRECQHFRVRQQRWQPPQAPRGHGKPLRREQRTDPLPPAGHGRSTRYLN